MAAVDPGTLNDPARLAEDFETVLERLEAARSFGKAMQQQHLFARAKKLLRSAEGIRQLYRFAPRFDAGGVFSGGDWAEPAQLQTALVSGTLRGGGPNAILECLSELRMLAIAEGESTYAGMDPATARTFLEQVLANNLDLLFPVVTEETREGDAEAAERVENLFHFILERLGASAILESLISEVERVLLQRPIMVQRVESLLRSARQALGQFKDDDRSVDYARDWLSALDGPTQLARSVDRDEYAAALTGLTHEQLSLEAETFGWSMSQTGLVAAQHADLLRHLVDHAPDLLASSLALNSVGAVSLSTHQNVITDIIRFAIWRETARSIYGLSKMLDQGSVFIRPVLPGLRRLMMLTIHPEVAETLREASEWQDPPDANVLLLAGTVSVLGQPRGVDQGHNPTCQAARAISLWAQNDVGYLLELIAFAARENEIISHFEGTTIRSSELSFGLAKTLHTELDPVSLLLTPHLDRIYMEMSRHTIGREGDGHRWVNPELHGWWVHRGFAELIDTGTGAVTHCDDFIRTFYSAYHPLYNGGRDLVYAQPCGIATTNHSAELVGWHAVSIQRVGCDPHGQWRVYFFNPNRDKGQNWGQGMFTSTHDCGELEGESSLPFEQFLARVYVFHYKKRETGDSSTVPDDAVARVRQLIAESWAADKPWDDG
ncbi:hypothetical protein [Salinisphaera aquimarina]|uniref:Zorya protein ZorC EH domain-containing protein n=1 Tax=Salinisphaera aquimarina TaxID=2094031 RepID=A0ABV7ETZ4_9GAMM